MPIQEYPYVLDANSLEIFPEFISSDPYIIFHGTSEYHSKNIENNGFQRGIIPFDLKAGKLLEELLTHPDIKKFDLPNRFGQTCYSLFNSYLIHIQNAQIRLSFSHLSYACVPFAFGSSKGGQTLNHIINAEVIIQNAINHNSSLRKEIDPAISTLFDNVRDIQNARGVIYAIKFPSTLDGLEMGVGVIHSTLEIPRENIIGKIFIPTNVNINLITVQEISAKHRTKLYCNPNGLGILIDRKNNPEREVKWELY